MTQSASRLTITMVTVKAWAMTFLVVPRRELATGIAAGVLTVTCGLEFLQFWHPPWLQGIRSTFVGASMLGTSFSWWDFPAYVGGAGVGWVVLRRRQWVSESREPSGAVGARPLD